MRNIGRKNADSIKRHQPLCFLSVLLMLAFAVTIAGCSKFIVKRSILKLDGGLEGQEIGIYKIREDVAKKQKIYIPVAKLRSGREILLENDDYMLANECSGLALLHDKDRVVTLTKVHLETTSEKPTLMTACVDPIDEHHSTWTDRADFSFLPGEVRFYVGGLPIVNELKVVPLPPVVTLRLFPLSVSAMDSTQSEKFFVSPEFPDSPQTEGVVISAKVGEALWLLPGNYGLEVNGSRRKISIDQNRHTEVPLGIIRIETPPGFPIAGKAFKAGDDVQPVFAYINESVLFNLNNDYYVFPGNYLVSIAGSDVKSQFKVEAGKKTTIKTRGAQINLPPCSEGKGACKNPPKITIHTDRSSYALMTVDPGVPFLVFDGLSYQYGVEGTRGLLRDLATSLDGVKKETLAHVHIIWEPKVTERKTRAELVRFESRGTTNFGKTLDLLFHKPDNLFAPPGTYHLTYNLFVSGSEPGKVRLDAVLRENETFEIKVPIYSEKSDSAALNQAGGSDASSGISRQGSMGGASGEGTQKIPSKLVPIHK